MKFKNNQELEIFINDISESIKHIIWKNFPQTTHDEQEDITQEVKLKIWKILSSGKKIENLRSYLWKVVYTTALDFINNKMFFIGIHNKTEANYSTLLSEVDIHSAESILEKKEAEKFLMEVINSLSKNRRIVIKLHLLGMNIIEIADFLCWSESKVNHLYYRGIEDLRKRLNTRNIKNES